ncbi:NDP-hexose 2,3-dehydratase family protein [Streptomyces sp. NPDC055036]
MSARIAESMRSPGHWFKDLAEFHHWWATLKGRAEVERVPLESLTGWDRAPGTGNIGHETGKFFTIEGLDVQAEDAPVRHWQQPIINQPETGILGILVRELEGVLHCLMQAKAEPGNRGGLQLSPTVQATRSNYTRVHGGSPVPYLSYFRDTGPHRVIADVRQSEQGAWFHRKRNRNMLVEVTDDIEVLDGFCWLSIGQLYRLLAEEDLINMDARTVLSCLPVTGPPARLELPTDQDAFTAALVRSLDPAAGGAHTMDDVLTWITDARSRTELSATRIPLDGLRGWHRRDGGISHESGRFFDVIGVEVTAVGREVRRWSQPMIRPYGTGVVALLVKEIDGVLHGLMRQRAEPGFLDVTELAPTVQCTPGNLDVLPAGARPRFLDEVLAAGPGAIRYDVPLSEEGGRFHHAVNRYLIVETERDVPAGDPDFRWMSPHQLLELLRHSHYVNVQARTLIACLLGLTVSRPSSDSV